MVAAVVKETLESVTNLSETAAAARCENFYLHDIPGGWCHCLKPEDNVNRNIAGHLRRQQPVTRLLTPTDGAAAASGGLAVLLRGGAFRGSKDDTEAMRFKSQLLASTSIAEKIVRPYTELGTRVRIFLTLYSDVSENQTRALYAPYAAHVPETSARTRS